MTQFQRVARAALVVCAAVLLLSCGGSNDADLERLATEKVGAPHRSNATQMGMGAKRAMRDELEAPSQTARSIEATAKALAVSNDSSSIGSELYWFNPTTGDTVAWGMNGTAKTSSTSLLRSPGWQITHIADLNGDGQPDLIWQNLGTGQTVAWLMNGNVILQSTLLLTAPGWKVIKTGDFNGDGKADLLWYNAQTAQTVVWLMNGVSVVSNQLLLTDANWQVAQVGDFDGDGKTDLLWYSGAFQQTAVWLMNGATKKQGASILAAPGWQVTNVGDLDGDGKADLIWYNSSAGQTVAWLMDGLDHKTNQLLLTDPNWRVSAVLDLNADGKADLLWYAPGLQQTAAWIMNGVAKVSGALLLDVPGWQVYQTIDLDGNGTADLVWTNAASGQTVAWLMKGLQSVSSTLLLTDPNYRVSMARPRAPAFPPISKGSVPKLRGTQVDTSPEWLDTNSSRWNRNNYLANTRANVFRLFIQPFSTVDGSPLLPGQSLSARLLESLKQWELLINWCARNNIYVLITADLEIGYPISASWPDDGRSLWKDSSAQQEFVTAWKALATKYAGRPGVLFDLMNEPHGILADEISGNHAIPKAVWNSLYPQIVSAVRTVDPDKWLVVEPIWGDPGNFSDLQVNADSKLIYSFHFYAPHYFTLQGNGSYPPGGTVSYPSTTQDSQYVSPQYWDKARLAAELAPAKTFATSHAVRVMMGEAGVSRSAASDDRARWMTDVLSLVEANDFDFLFFQYEGWGVPADFGFGWTFDNSSIEQMVLGEFRLN